MRRCTAPRFFVLQTFFVAGGKSGSKIITIRFPEGNCPTRFSAGNQKILEFTLTFVQQKKETVVFGSIIF